MNGTEMKILERWLPVESHDIIPRSSGKETIDEVKEFVRVKCEGRDHSHGYRHMEKVASVALQIFDAEFKERYPGIRPMVEIVAWLHDVADPKYDKDGSLRTEVQEFVSEIFFHWRRIMMVLDRISYSKEKKVVEKDLPAWLGCESPDFELIRNIVSDADKLEALGEAGLTRCIQYTLVAHPEYTFKELQQHVEAHAKEKLLGLHNYIRTTEGKRLAVDLTNQLRESLKLFMM